MTTSNTETGPPKPIDRIRAVAQSKRLAVIDGVSVDEVTASMVVKVYDGLSEKRKEKFDKLSVKKLVCKAFELSGNV